MGFGEHFEPIYTHFIYDLITRKPKKFTIFVRNYKCDKCGKFVCNENAYITFISHENLHIALANLLNIDISGRLDNIEHFFAQHNCYKNNEKIIRLGKLNAS